MLESDGLLDDLSLFDFPFDSEDEREINMQKERKQSMEQQQQQQQQHAPLSRSRDTPSPTSTINTTISMEKSVNVNLTSATSVKSNKRSSITAEITPEHYEKEKASRIAKSSSSRSNVSSSANNTTQDTDDDEDLQLLMQVPELLQQFFNVGDTEKLRQLFNDVCSDNFILKSTAMVSEEVGKTKAIEFFQSLLRAMPDSVLMAKPSKYNQDKGVIVSKMFYTGTKQFIDHNEYMFNLTLLGPQEDVDPTLRQKALAIVSAGGRYQVFNRTNFIMVLDTQRKKIQKLIIDQKTIDIKEAPAL